VRTFLVRALVVLALVGTAGVVRRLTDRPVQAAGPRAGYFPDVVLHNQDGKPVRFYSDLVRGKKVLINMMYTRCDGI